MSEKNVSEPQARGPGPHGHQNPLYLGAYQRGCRCGECVGACRRYHREHQRDYARAPEVRERVNERQRRRYRRAVRSGVVGLMAHLRPTLAVGNSGYAAGCRCVGCCVGRREYNRRKRLAQPVGGEA